MALHLNDDSTNFIDNFLFYSTFFIVYCFVFVLQIFAFSSNFPNLRLIGASATEVKSSQRKIRSINSNQKPATLLVNRFEATTQIQGINWFSRFPSAALVLPTQFWFHLLLSLLIV